MADWYSRNWQYRQKFTITNNVATDIAIIPVRVTLDHATLVTAGKSRADGNDIVFTEKNGVNQLDHWIESGLNTSSCVIWVKINYIVASGTDDFYMYYGNGTATNSENPIGLFTQFYNFEIDYTDDWEWFFSSDDYSVTNEILRINEGGIRRNATDITQGGYVIESRMKFLETIAAYSGVLEATSNGLFTAGSNAESDATVLFMRNTSSTNMHVFVADGTTTGYNIASNVNLTTTANDTWYVFGIKGRTDGVDLEKDYTNVGTYDFSWTKEMYGMTMGAFAGASSENIMDTQYDWIRVRKYVETEPSVSFSSEETVEDQPVQEYGLAISTPGFDVNNAEEKDLIYSTKYSSPQPVMAIYVSAHGRMPHDLGFAPAYYVDVERDYFDSIMVDEHYIYNSTDYDKFVYLFFLNLDCV